MSWLHLLGEALAVTGFVAVMMVLVEVLNVATAGALRRFAERRGVASYAGAALLGAAPGCLGSFAATSLYVHGALPFGAIVANMIATSGDEAFIMLALFPERALLLIALLLVYAVVVGWAVDRVAGPRFWPSPACASGLAVHPEEEGVGLGVRALHLPPHLSVPRATLGAGLGSFVGVLGFGVLGPAEWGAVRITLLVLAMVAVVLVATVPEHFLREHLWRHIAREHVPRLFLWVASVMLAIEGLRALGLPLESVLRAHPAWALLLAVLVGVVPQSGPHMVFVTLFAQGAVPFSVLVASSVVQDGHGALPLLAESRVEFLKVKAVNVIAGLLLGGLLMGLGF